MFIKYVRKIMLTINFEKVNDIEVKIFKGVD